MYFFPGITVQTPDGIMNSKAMILLCTADLPAKAKVANSVQYNGYYGCNTCNIRGQYLGHNMCWPYDPSAIIRSHQSILAHAKEAVTTSQCNDPVSVFQNCALINNSLFLGLWD